MRFKGAPTTCKEPESTQKAIRNSKSRSFLGEYMLHRFVLFPSGVVWPLLWIQRWVSISHFVPLTWRQIWPSAVRHLLHRWFTYCRLMIPLGRFMPVQFNRRKDIRET